MNKIQLRKKFRALRGNINQRDVLSERICDILFESDLYKNADTAFQEGLNERRDLFEPEIKAKVVKEFAEMLKFRIINTPFWVNRTGENEHYKEGYYKLKNNHQYIKYFLWFIYLFILLDWIWILY